MENTLTLFEDQNEQIWHTVIDQNIVGPLSGKDIAQYVLSGKLSVADHVWKKSFLNWKRISEIDSFSLLMPGAPEDKFLAIIKAKLESEKKPPKQPPVQDGRVWYVHLNDAQYGPFADAEVQMMIDSGRVVADSYVWRQGMKEWEVIAKTKAWQNLFKEKAAEKAADKRAAPRKPLEARILLSDGSEVGWAICRDISTGGMQVLMDRVPGQKGHKIKLNINETDDIPAFACDGVIVRILEDGRGFSFRFESLPKAAKEAIESYIEA